MSRFRLQEMPPWRLPDDFQVVPFELAHYHNYEPGPQDLPQEFKADVEAALPRWVGKATTIKRGEEIFGIGAVFLDGTTGRAWILLSEKARRMPKELYGTVKYILQRTLREVPMERFEVLADPDMAVAHGWLTKLGFVPTGDRVGKFRRYRYECR
ncbi:MAG: hypothetical protein O2912_06640 [Proteobacteria bacterium]|nr:hypothetical protein [Pseudomonadota bacterium]